MRFIVLGLSLLSTPTFAVPAQFTHQGRLMDADGTPLEGETEIGFRLMDTDFGGSAVWEEVRTVVINNGFYSTILGVDEETNPLDTDVLEQAPLWLEIQIVGEPTMVPRTPINSVPYANMASVAEEIEGGPVNATQIAVSGAVVIDEGGEWVGPARPVSWSEIEGMPSGFADGVDDDSLSEDSFVALGLSCVDGDVPFWDGAAEEWGCGLDQDTLADLACLDGQVVSWSGDVAGWVCIEATDRTLTEEEVDAFVADNGYATATDVFSGAWADLSGVPEGLDDGDTVLTEEEVDAFVADNGYAAATDVFSGAWADLSDVPDGLDDGDDDALTTLGASCGTDGVARWDSVTEAWICADDADTLQGLDCTDGQIAAWSTSSGAWGCEDASGGGSGETDATLTLGESDGGVNLSSSDTPIVIPDDNAEGVSSLVFLSSSEEVQTVTVDVELSHTDMSQITIKLFSPPPGPVVTLYDGGAPGEADLNTNFGWVTPFADGNIYSFYNGEDAAGTWRLQVIDEGDGETGTLDGWTIHVNEEWDGSLFVGDSVTVPGTVEVREELRVARGAELVFTDIHGEETARLDGHGIVPTGGIIMWSGSEVPNGWALCDGTLGTPNLSDRFIVAAGSEYDVGSSGNSRASVSMNTNHLRYQTSCCFGTGGNYIDSITVSDIRPKYYALAFIMRL